MIMDLGKELKIICSSNDMIYLKIEVILTGDYNSD